MLTWKILDPSIERYMFKMLRKLDVGKGDYKVPFVFDVSFGAINIHARNKINPRVPETVMTIYTNWTPGRMAVIDTRIADQVNGLTEVPGDEAIKFWEHIWSMAEMEMEIKEGKGKIVNKDGVVIFNLEDMFTTWFRERYV